MNTVSIVNAKGTHRECLPGKSSFLAVGLLAAGAILLATRIYFVSELLVLLVALAVLFALGTGALFLLVLLQEGVRWSVRQIIEAKQRTIYFRGRPSIQRSNADR